MGKRSDFERLPRDLYITPRSALEPLLPWLTPGTRFIEPCAADYGLAALLEAEGHHCVAAYDIEPQHPQVERLDALEEDWRDHYDRADMFITNTPWRREILHGMIDAFSVARPTWVLFDADWLNTTQDVVAKKHGVPTATELRKRLHMVVSVGRVRWIPGSKHQGKDNAAWYLFSPTPRTTLGPVFIGP